MKTDINTELFKRYSPKKKLELISVLTGQELLAITPDTIKRIIKEVGVSYPHSRDKKLSISQELRTGNNWNSRIVSWNSSKGRVFVNFYIQYANTDTTRSCLLNNFLNLPDFKISLTEDDRYGNPQTYYASYDEGDKCRAIRALLTQYIYSKYPEKV